MLKKIKFKPLFGHEGHIRIMEKLDDLELLHRKWENGEKSHRLRGIIRDKTDEANKLITFFNDRDKVKQ